MLDLSNKLTTIIVETGSRAIANISNNTRKPDLIGNFLSSQIA
ncbi:MULTISPECIES: hypothetical protein [unclassified Microcoleus]|nr:MULTISPECIES: hypothetical protein [unclassified Microcoleus]